MQTFWLDEGVGSRVQLHQTIALVDCLNFRKKADSAEVPKDEDETNVLAENELLLRQLVHADKILLNKVDLIEEAKRAEELGHIRQHISHVNKHAQMKETEYAKAELDFLLTKSESEKPRSTDASLGHDHALSHKIMHAIKSVYVELDDGTTLSKEKLEFLIGEMLWEGAERGIDVMRCKGVFIDSDTSKVHMLQGVQDLFELRELNPQPADCSKVKSSFLFVGKGDLEASKIKEDMLTRCSAKL